MAFRPYGIGCDHVRSFDTESAPRISQEPFGLESSNFAGTSIPAYFTAAPDMTSLSTSAILIVKKTVENPARNGFGWNVSIMVLARITKLYTLLAENLPHKPAGYDVRH